MLASRQVIFDTGRRLISDKKELLRAEKESPSTSGEKDLLTLLSESCHYFFLKWQLILFAVKSNLGNDSAKRLSDSDLLDQISSFFFAGSDSTALALSWSLYFLALHPDIQTRLRTELTHPITLDSSSTTSFHFEDRAYDVLESFTLLDAVVRETLRLVPPVHGTLRVATQNDLIPVSEPVVLSDGTVVSPGEHIQIRKGSIIHIPFEGLNFAKDIWSEDPLEFR